MTKDCRQCLNGKPHDEEVEVFCLPGGMDVPPGAAASCDRFDGVATVHLRPKPAQFYCDWQGRGD